MRHVVVGLAVVMASVAGAQERGIELTPTLGYVDGGGIIVEDRTFTLRDVSLDIDSSGTYGLKLDIPIMNRLAIEVMLQRQESQFKDQQALFGQEPGGFFPVGSTTAILDVDLTHYHVGVTYELGDNWARAFLAGTVGMTQIDPKLELPSETVPSISAGGGFKLDLNNTLGLRFEGRLYYIATDDGTSATVQFEHPECGSNPCTYTYRYDSEMTQIELSVGLIIRF